MSISPSRVCPLCAHQDGFREPTELPGGGWLFVCDLHDPPLVFETTADNEMSDYPEGPAAELGVYHDLPTCLVAGDPWVEYGVLEYCYGVAHPEEYRELVKTYGHVAIADTRYSASSYIAGTLGRMNAKGDLAMSGGPATGRWSYNSGISYWALTPAPSETPTLTWEAYATNNGIDPKTWPIIG